MGQMIKFKFSLGDTVEDTVVDFSGTVTGMTVYLNGCKQVAVTRKEPNKDGTSVTHWIDEGQLKKLRGKATKKKTKKDSPGGPQSSTPPGVGGR
jgi:hypothetical protein